MVVRAGERFGGVVLAAAALVTAWALVSAPALSATRGEERSDEYLKQAQEYLQQRNPNAAIIELKNALQQNPENVAARRLLGIIHLRSGDGPSAEKEFTKVRELAPNDAENTINLARAYLLQNKFADALDVVPEDFADHVVDEKTQEINESLKAAAYVVRGQAFLGLHDFKESERTLREADKLNPYDVTALVGIAQGLIARHEYPAAEKEVDRALERKPDSAEANTLKGEILRMRNELEPAIRHFDTAIEKKPYSVAARLGRAASLIDVGRDEESQKDLDYVLRRLPNQPLAVYLSAFVKAKRQDFQGAVEILEKAGGALDDHLPSTFLMGAADYALERFEQAARNLERYLDAVPDNARARRLLGATYVRQGQAQKAIQTLEPLVRTGTADPQIASLLATAYVRAGRYSEGMELFEKASAAAPDAANIRTQLALTRLAMGQAKGAITDLERALELAPDAQQINILLALVKLRNRDYDGALDAAKRLHDIAPDNPLAENLMGAAHLGKGDLATAETQFRTAIEKYPDFIPARMNLAQLFLARNENDKARTEYERILERNDKHIGAMMGLARLAARENRGDQVVSWLERAADADPTSAEPRLKLVDYYARAREFDKAIGVAQQLNRAVPNNPRVLEALGRTQAAAGEPVLAAATFQRLATLLPKSVRALGLLSGVQIASKDFVGARDSLRRAIELNGKYVPARVALIELEMGQKHYDAALEMIGPLRKIAPDSPVADSLLADIKVRQGKYEEAYKSYDTALRKKDEAVLAIRRFDAAAAAGRRDEGLKELQTWVDRTGDARVRHHLAGAYLFANDHAKAIREFETLFKAESQNPVLLNNLAWLYQQTKDKRAREFAERALERAPNSPAVMDTLGWILLEEGDLASGLEFLGKAHKLVPNQGDIHYHYAAALEANGKGGESCAEVNTLLKSGVRFAQTKEAATLQTKVCNGGK